jgi:hypothetical protein
MLMQGPLAAHYATLRGERRREAKSLSDWGWSGER